MQSWAQQHLPDAVSEGSRAYLLALFEEHVDAGLGWVRSHGSEYVPSVNIALVTSLTSLVQVHLPDQPHMSCLLTPCVATSMLLPRTETHAFHGGVFCLGPVLPVPLTQSCCSGQIMGCIYLTAVALQSKQTVFPFVWLPLSLLVAIHCSATCCHAQLWSDLR